MEAELIESVRIATRRFARQQVAPMVGTAGRDGALERLPSMYAQAVELGLVGSAAPDGARESLGAWAVGSDAGSATLSLAVLEELATACAGFAAVVHYGSLATSEIGGSAPSGRRLAVAAPSPAWVLARAGGIGIAAEPCPSIEQRNGGLRLSGRAAFVYGPPEPEGFVIYATTAGELRRVLVEAGEIRPRLADMGARIGLAALSAMTLDLDSVALSPACALEPGHIERLLARTWLGLCAIALGNTSGALAAARRYASERYQGGKLIAEHPAVQLLLGEGEARTAVCRRALFSAAAGDASDLRQAALLRAQLPASCARAVSDCLQVLGGYGYMEDYRIEKRLRDALAIASLAGRRADVLRWLALSAGEETP